MKTVYGKLCDECQTVRHCSMKGCVPITCEGTLDEPIRRSNVLAVGFAIACVALMGAAAVFLK